MLIAQPANDAGSPARDTDWLPPIVIGAVLLVIAVVFASNLFGITDRFARRIRRGWVERSLHGAPPGEGPDAAERRLASDLRVAGGLGAGLIGMIAILAGLLGLALTSNTPT